MTHNLPSGLISHTRRVQSLYKKVMRDVEAWNSDRAIFRYKASLMREQFDKNKNITDMRIAKQILHDAEEEFFQKAHYMPTKFVPSPGGVAYDRKVWPPDWVLDYWHPLEKAEYPEYFARRELRKKEFVKMWEEKYGKQKAFTTH